MWWRNPLGILSTSAMTGSLLLFLPEVNSVTCKRQASLAQYPISALGNESFARCQAPRMHLPGYAFFFLIGPSTFLASICVGILLGSLAVARLKRRTTASCI